MICRDVASERGSSTVLAVGLIAVLLTVTLAALAVLSAVRAAHVARSVSDLAALAGAIEYQQSPDAGAACAEATRIAARHDVQVITCRIGGGGEVTVTTSAAIPLRLGGLGPDHAEGTARAGPAPLAETPR